MPYWKQALRAAAIMVGGLVALILATSLAILAKPQWFLNTATFSRAIRHFGSNYQPTWRDLSLDVESPSLFQKEISLRASDFCFKTASDSAEGCLKSLDTLLGVRIARDGLHVTRVARFLLQGDHLLVDGIKYPPVPKKKNNTSLYLPPLLPKFLRGLEIGRLAVSLPSTEIRQASATLKGELTVDFKSGEKRPLLLRAKIIRTAGKVARHYSVQASLISDFLEKRGLSFIDIDALLTGESGTRVHLEARAAEASPREIKLKFTAAAQNGPWRLAVSGHASETPETYTVAAALQASSSSGPITSFSLRPLAFSASLDPSSRRPQALVLNTRFSLEPGAFGVKKKRIPIKTIRGRVSLRATATPSLGCADHFDAVLAVALAPVKDWYEFGGSLQASLSGQTSRLQDTAIKEKIDFDLKMARFKDLVTYLSGTLYAVPAPFASLDGSLGVELHSQADMDRDPQEVGYIFKSNLRGKRQRLKMTIDGKLAIFDLAGSSRAFTNTASISLDDVALQMPVLNIKGMPSVMRDKRIFHLNPKAAAVVATSVRSSTRTFSSIAGTIRILTPKPVIIYSNFAKTPVPLTINLTAANPPLTLGGVVAFQSFYLELFRRQALVDHIHLTAIPGSKLIAIDGLVVYKTPDAVVSIRLSGTTAKPRVGFESDPPYTRQEIIALLLFGKSPGQLDADQQMTVANTQSAFSEEAFGLASLYLFASTPIEFIGYDPDSRAYSMKFRLPGSASLAIGSSAAEPESLTLRKRLGAHWAIETEAGRSELQGNVATTLLEWFDHY